MKFDDLVNQQDNNLHTENLWALTETAVDSFTDEADRLLHFEPMNLWEMANLSPTTTGISGIIVWVSSGESARHGPRIKICRGPRWNPRQCASIPINGMPRIIGDIDLSSDEFSDVVKWMMQNREALLQFWSGDIQTTDGLIDVLTPI